MNDEPSTMTEEVGSRPPRPVESAHLYAVFDCMAPMAPCRHSLADVKVVALGRAAARSVNRNSEGGQRMLRLTFADQLMSAQHARLEYEDGKWLLRDQGSHNGTRLNGHPCTEAELEDGDFFELGRIFFLFRARQRDRGADVLSGPTTLTLVPELEEQWERVSALVASGLPVQVQGAPGVGKELAARELHRLAGRRGDFVSVNCGALPRELAPGLLEGHERAIFTSADRANQGLVRAADGGTLFLDEVGDLPEALQAVLLRVLAEKAVLPLGASRPVPVDFRLVSATNRNLRKMVDEGTFRSDLRDRLRGVDLVLPRLLDRKEDLGLLTDRLARPPGGRSITFSSEVARALFRHPWPGNVRDLKACLIYATTLAREGEVQLEHLPPEVVSEPPRPPLSEEDAQLKQTLVDAFKRHRGNESAVARELGVKRMTVWRWRKRLGIEPDDGA